MMVRRMVAGCMTGTSLDGLDAALVAIEGSGLAMQARFVRGVSRPLGAPGAQLRQLAGQEPMSARAIAQLTREFALLHVEALRELLNGAGAPSAKPDLVCIHGQTVYHLPPVSWQLFNPAPLVQALGVPVVFDLRSADLAAGGQGAPITPLADWVLFRRAATREETSGNRTPLAVVNLGGFINCTALPGGGLSSSAQAHPAEEDVARQLAQIEGGDVCVCNQLLDGIARQLFDESYDQDGRRAGAGQVRDEPLAELIAILVRQAKAGRSLGTGDEAGAWLGRWRTRTAPGDIAATACRAIAHTVTQQLPGCALLLAGGGVRNLALRAALQSSCRHSVHTTDEHGIPAEYREAVCMAVLGALCQDRVPITLPQITRTTTPPPVAGCWMHP
jgi:anhydro-N-acetylmuramic acid kinase